MTDYPEYARLAMAIVFVDLPQAIIALAGLWLAVTRWRSHPRASLVASVGFALLLAATVAALAGRKLLYERAGVTTYDDSVVQIATLSSIAHFGMQFAAALIVIGIFVGRSRSVSGTTL